MLSWLVPLWVLVSPVGAQAAVGVAEQVAHRGAQEGDPDHGHHGDQAHQEGVFDHGGAAFAARTTRQCAPHPPEGRRIVPVRCRHVGSRLLRLRYEPRVRPSPPRAATRGVVRQATAWPRQGAGLGHRRCTLVAVGPRPDAETRGRSVPRAPVTPTPPTGSAGGGSGGPSHEQGHPSNLPGYATGRTRETRISGTNGTDLLAGIRKGATSGTICGGSRTN